METLSTLSSLPGSGASMSRTGSDAAPPARPRQPLTAPLCAGPRRARIYQPAYRPRQRGCRTRWVLEFEPETKPQIAPSGLWTFAADPLRQVRLHFATLEQACAYARRHGHEVEIAAPSASRPKPRFSTQPNDAAA